MGISAGRNTQPPCGMTRGQKADAPLVRPLSLEGVRRMQRQVIWLHVVPREQHAANDVRLHSQLRDSVGFGADLRATELPLLSPAFRPGHLCGTLCGYVAEL